MAGGQQALYYREKKKRSTEIRWRALLLLAKEGKAPSLPAEVQSQNKCSALGKDEGEQGPLGEASEPAEPQPNINKKSKRQLIGIGDSHL